MLNGFLIACSLYTRIPLKPIDWFDYGRKYVLFFLPVIGFIVGFGWWLLGQFLLGGSFIMACLLSLYPYFICGFIHLDGYMDCSDALLSSANQEKKLMILKDSHVGAFAVLAAIILFLLNFSSIMSLKQSWALFIIPVLVRICAIELQYHTPVLETSSMSKHFMEGVSQRMKTVFHLYPLLAGIISYSFIGPSVLILWGYALVHTIVVKGWLMKEFKGVNGDMCGMLIESMQCGCLIIACFL